LSNLSSDVESILIIVSVQIAVAANSSVRVELQAERDKIDKMESMELCGQSGFCMNFSVENIPLIH
jgi:hypothetical protein